MNGSQFDYVPLVRGDRGRGGEIGEEKSGGGGRERDGRDRDRDRDRDERGGDSDSPGISEARTSDSLHSYI